MDVRIGVTDTPKEIDIDLADDVNADAIKKEIESAISGKVPILWLTDRKGRTVGIPSPKIAYVEVGVPSGERRIGYVS